MQSIDSIETYAYGMNKYLVCKKEEIKCIIKQSKIVWLYYKRRHKKIIQIGQRFLTIHIEY